MSESNGRGETDAARRRRIRFRAWHRGMREVDLLLGGFADAHLDGLDDAELTAFEVLLDVPDPVVLAWIIGETAAPADMDSPLLRGLVAFHRNGPPRGGP